MVGKGTPFFYIGIGFQVIFFIFTISIKNMPLYAIIIGYLIGFLIIGYGIYGWNKSRVYAGNFEIEILPSRYLDDSPYYGVTPGSGLSAIFNLTIVNHNIDHKLHIKAAYLLLQTKRLFFRKTLFSLPLTVQAIPQRYLLNAVDIEKQSKKEFPILTYGKLPTITPFPRTSELVLRLDMIGLIRHKEYILRVIKHDPKQIPDIPELPSGE